MQERLERIEQKLDKVVDAQAGMKADLQEHMRRTQIAEDNIEKLANAMQPIQLHVAFVKNLGKLLLAIFGLAASIATVWNMFIK